MREIAPPRQLHRWASLVSPVKYSRLIRLLLLLAALLLYLYQLNTWDCHFGCRFLETPVGLAIILLPTALFLWLRYPGFILALALSFLTFILGLSNLARVRAGEIAEAGPDRWFQFALDRSWGYLFAMALSLVIGGYALASLSRRAGARNAT
jgi:hypothetical protein